MHSLKKNGGNLKPNLDKIIFNNVPLTGMDSLLLEKEKGRQQVQDLLKDPAKYQKGKLS